jgi:hypothetical protein
MAGGSPEPDGPDDFQCQNCGRWYARIGLTQHESSCSHPEWAEPLVELVDADDHPMMGGPDEIDEEVVDEDQDDALEGDQDDVVDEPTAPEPEPAAPTAATDGGNPIFDGPEPTPTTDGGDPDDDPRCPECDGNVFFDASEHTDFEFGCPNCSSEEEWVVWNE